MEEPAPNPPTIFGRNAPNNGLRLVLEETDRVGKRLDSALGDHLDNIYILLGMIPNATRRIITEIGQAQTPQDHCAVFHASRVLNNATGTLMLLRKGLLVEASTLLRSTLETAAQAVLFLHDAVAATAWTEGKRFEPKEVRKKLNGKPDFGPLYKALSDSSHPNPDARWLHSVAVPPGYAITYGGSYQPKGAARLLAILVDVILVYFAEFHRHYKGRLSVDFWPFMIDMGTTLNHELEEWVDTLPNDRDALAEWFARGTVEPMPAMPIDKATLNRALASLAARQAERASETRNTHQD